MCPGIVTNRLQLEKFFVFKETVLLLDGLDEIDHSLRGHVSRITKDMQMQFPSVRIVIASRPIELVGWDN